MAKKPTPGTSPSSPDELPEGRYSDRELSWLAFNERVLDLARDTERIPLLERAKFLAIFSSNLDEFFMVRVAGLKRRIDAGVAVPSVAGMLPRELHDAILARTHDLVSEQSRVFAEEVRPGLVDEGIEILRWAELSDDEKGRMRTLFSERIFPILTPLAVDPSHPFPYIRGLSINLAVMLANPITGAEQFARVKVPSVLPRLVNLGEGRFLPLEEIISRHLDQLFTGMHVLQHTTFRVTRNEDLEVEEDDAENLLFALEKELLRRKVGRPPVRLEVQDDISAEMLELLTRELDIRDKEVFRLPAPLDLTGLFSLADVDRDDLSYPNFLPITHPHLAEVETARPADMFAAIRRRDVLVHHPTTPSPPACSGSSSKLLKTPRCWPSNKPCTALPATPPSLTPSSMPPRLASRCWRSWRLRRGSTNRPTSPGPDCWNGPESTSFTAWWASRPTASWPW
ncbi:polyphosphate kinase [Cutibacterium acnes JCM 18918]|nr:polyphosphate kinase [Cutibacterium acnes JCM 18918]